MIKLLPEKQQMLYGIDCALLTLPAWRKAYPKDKRPENALNVALKSVLEGNVTKKELNKAAIAANSAAYAANAAHMVTFAIHAVTTAIPAAISSQVAHVVFASVRTIGWEAVKELYYQTNHPFEPHYRTPDTLGLAREIYETKDFSLMPILADALTDLDCPNTESVRHSKAYSNWVLYHLGV